MIIKNNGYTIELTWKELRDMSNALHDALQFRNGDNSGSYPICEYIRLQQKIQRKDINE